MFASAIRIDRPVEANIWRFIAGNNLSRCVDRDRRLERREFVKRSPPIIERDTSQRFVTSRCVTLGSPATPALVVDYNPEQLADIVIGARRRGGQLLHRRASLGCV